MVGRSAAIAFAVIGLAGSAAAQSEPAPPPAEPPPPVSTSTEPANVMSSKPPSNDVPPTGAAVAPVDVRVDVPVLALTHSAFGARARKIGAHLFGYGQQASSGSEGGAGLTLYGSPLDRLTLLAVAERRASGTYAPSLSLAYRILGSLDDGWALAAMGTYKAEGFAEVEGEVELGVLLSMIRNGWHFDLNSVVGGGLEESEEFDAEAKLRAGYDVVDWLRVGLDSRARFRLRGDILLAGGRKWDVVGGPQVLATWSQFYASLLAGPTTVDVPSSVGGVAWLTVGGVVP